MKVTKQIEMSIAIINEDTLSINEDGQHIMSIEVNKIAPDVLHDILLCMGITWGNYEELRRIG